MWVSIGVFTDNDCLIIDTFKQNNIRSLSIWINKKQD